MAAAKKKKEKKLGIFYFYALFSSFLVEYVKTRVKYSTAIGSNTAASILIGGATIEFWRAN